MDVAAYTNRLAAFSVEKFRSHRIFCDRVLAFQPGQRGVVSNGKVSDMMIVVNVFNFCSKNAFLTFFIILTFKKVTIMCR